MPAGRRSPAMFPRPVRPTDITGPGLVCKPGLGVSRSGPTPAGPVRPDFLLHSGALVRRRTTGWARRPRENEADLTLLMDLYDLSRTKTRRALKTLRPDKRSSEAVRRSSATRRLPEYDNVGSRYVLGFTAATESPLT